jgi:AcrR family transcriptional regulator
MADTTRLPLTRDRVLAAATGLADASGVEALTMRRLGDELGYEAMSLYRHVANKHDLLDGMLELVLAEWRLPGGGADWQEEIRASAQSVHDALRRHPWAARLLMGGSHIQPRRMAYMDALLGSLRTAGFDAGATYYVYHLLDGFIFGFSLWEIAYTRIDAGVSEEAARLMAGVQWDSFPHLAEHRDQHMEDGGHKDVNAFEVGLDLLLAGLQRSLEP